MESPAIRLREANHEVSLILSRHFRFLLLPLVPVYRMAAAVHAFVYHSGSKPVHTLKWPVISIGNLSTGGVGKTPLTITLARELTHRGLLVDVLSRGYGRKGQTASRVMPGGTAAEFGDEPLLIAQEAQVPVYVAPERFDAGQIAELDAETALRGFAAEEAETARPDALAKETSLAIRNHENGLVQEVEAGCELDKAVEVHSQLQAPPKPALPVHLLDDGFQHRQLARTVNILLIDQDDWRDRLLPAGNLREPRDAARRATVIAVPADEPELEVALHLWGWAGPLWRLHRKMTVPRVEGRVVAFCGIARPEQFFAGVEAAGVKLAFRLAFADHCVYTPALLKEVLIKAQECQASAFVTTGKDLLRLGGMTSLFPQSIPLLTARLTVEIEEQDAAIDWLENQIRSQTSDPSL